MAPQVGRDILHVIRYLEKPVACNKLPAFPHLAVDALLPVYGPWNNVLCHTYATRPNWGHQPLLPYELAGGLDLSVWLMEDATLLKELLTLLENGEPYPLKIFQTTIKSFFNSGAGGPEQIQETLFPLDTQFSGRSTFEADPETTAFDGIQQEFPGNWVDAGKVTMAASKADNAAISTKMWDVQLLLVLSWVTLSALSAMRTGLRKIWQQWVATSFQKFLSVKYGDGWSEMLAAGRQAVVHGPSSKGATLNWGGRDQLNQHR